MMKTIVTKSALIPINRIAIGRLRNYARLTADIYAEQRAAEIRHRAECQTGKSAAGRCGTSNEGAALLQINASSCALCMLGFFA